MSEALLIEANRLRQVVEHLHALVHSQLGAAETVRKAQLVLSKAMDEAVDFPPFLAAPSPHSIEPKKRDKPEGD